MRLDQVPSDRCVYVLRRGGRVLGIVGGHVGDLLVAGCSRSVDPSFEDAMSKLVAQLPFGERKYADTAPIHYILVSTLGNILIPEPS